MEEPPSPSPTPTPQPCWSSIVKSQPPPQKQDNQNLTTTTTTAAAATNLVFTDTSKSTKGIAVAVIDANAIIQGGEKLTNTADKFVSVSEVIDEVRDPVSRHKLNFLPFTIDTMEPSPESLKKVINFARATGDLQTLSDVDIKLIALTYTLEAQIHGTKHLRDCPPPVHVVNVKRLPEKDMPGWGSNVPNLEEWEALEQEAEEESNSNSKILPLKDINLNIIPADDHLSSEDNVTETGSEAQAGDQAEGNQGFSKPKKYLPKKKEVNIEGKMVADGIDSSRGQYDDNASDWLPAVSRNTHRRFLRRKSRREIYETSSEIDVQQDREENMESDNIQDTRFSDQPLHGGSEETCGATGGSEDIEFVKGKNGDGDISSILNEMRLMEDQEKDQCPELDNSLVVEGTSENNGNLAAEGNVAEIVEEGSKHVEISSQTGESVDASFMDDDSSEQSWMLRSLSDSSVACITSDFAMQNVLLQMGLRLLASGGMQIRQLNRWILKCHACYEVTSEIGRIFCPKCGNGGTLRKVAVTVGENGITLAARRPRVTLRGTKFSLPLPQSGRDAITKNPILREDQVPHKVLYPKRKKKVNKEGDDIFASDDMFSHHTDKRAPLKPPVGRAVAVFSGKRNPNDNHYSRHRG